jgi:hypothetical protein
MPCFQDGLNPGKPETTIASLRPEPGTTLSQYFGEDRPESRSVLPALPGTAPSYSNDQKNSLPNRR